MASMILLALAQAAATPAPVAALPTDAYGAGMVCAGAVGIGRDPADGALQMTAEVTYFIMQAARANPGTVPYAERSTELIGQLRTMPPQTPAVAAANRQKCYQRWPMALGRAPVTLPTAKMPRGLTCIGALGVMVGAAQQLAKQGDKTALDRYGPSAGRWANSLDDAYLTSQGITTEAQMVKLMSDQLKASLSLGNVRSISDACVTAQS